MRDGCEEGGRGGEMGYVCDWFLVCKFTNDIYNNSNVFGQQITNKNISLLIY
jgi:hypothetical protein